MVARCGRGAGDNECCRQTHRLRRSPLADAPPTKPPPLVPQLLGFPIQLLGVLVSPILAVRYLVDKKDIYADLTDTVVSARWTDDGQRGWAWVGVPAPS